MLKLERIKKEKVRQLEQTEKNPVLTPEVKSTDEDELDELLNSYLESDEVRAEEEKQRSASSEVDLENMTFDDIEAIQGLFNGEKRRDLQDKTFTIKDSNIIKFDRRKQKINWPKEGSRIIKVETIELRKLTDKTFDYISANQEEFKQLFPGSDMEVEKVSGKGADFKLKFNFQRVKKTDGAETPFKISFDYNINEKKLKEKADQGDVNLNLDYKDILVLLKDVKNTKSIPESLNKDLQKRLSFKLGEEIIKYSKERKKTKEETVRHLNNISAMLNKDDFNMGYREAFTYLNENLEGIIKKRPINNLLYIMSRLARDEEKAKEQEAVM